MPRVLMYHSISRPEGNNIALHTSPERFEAQMLYLKRRSLRGVSMRELYLATNSGDTRGLVGLTFDDGYEDFLSAALPTLEKLGFSATVFVVAGKLGQENNWEHRGEPRARLKLLQANGVREVSERGMEVGAHSMTHPRLSGLDPEMLMHEVSDSRQVLKEIVGAPVEGFCYPYGDLDGAAIRVVRRTGYAYACATKKQIEHSAYDWPRTYVGEKDSPLRLGVKLKVVPILTRLRGVLFSKT
ncbi:MAG: polysaccharide deacetylase family protein [Rubrobacter sp.]|nr:polysaccharide deacetylase family protein [Rubrobacter sp.]